MSNTVPGFHRADIETLPRPELEALQLDRLRSTVNRLRERVPAMSDHLHLRIERAVDAVAVSDHQSLEKVIVERLRSSLGLGVTVAVEPAGSVPRSDGGKLSRTLDQRDL